MKKILLSSLAVCSLVLAEENYIEIGVGYMSGKDNFSTDSTKTINSYSTAKSESEAVPNVSFYYGKDISENANIYTSMEFGELAVGSEIETGIGLFDIGVKTDFMGEAWKNPFLLNTNREKTDVKEVGGYIGYGIPFSENYMASLKYEYSSVDFDKDEVVTDLKRDGKRHIITLENMYELNEDTMFMTNISYEKYKADGKASTYDQTGIELAMQKQLNERLELMIMGGLAKKDFDKSNPILNKKIDATIVSINGSLKYDEPLDYKDTYVKFNLGYENEDANHNFYDKSNTFGMLSVGYNF